MTQEVGFIKSVGQDFNLDELPVGKILFLLPHHVCTTKGDGKGGKMGRERSGEGGVRGDRQGW